MGKQSSLITRQKVSRPAQRARPRRGTGRLRWYRRGGRIIGFGVLALVAFVGPATAAFWAFTTPRFAVEAVEVRGSSRVPADRIVAAAGITQGANLWAIDPDSVIQRLEALPEIARAELIRELPNRVAIIVEERRPFTLVHNGRLHWVDEEGRMLREAREAVAPPVPVISGLSDDELTTMRTVPAPRARAAIALIRALLRTNSRLVAEISEIDMSRREGPVLYTVSGIEVRLGGEEWEERLARLEGVLANVGENADAVRAIDLRFRGQVVLTRAGQG